jgi:hypothetical protein
MGIGTLSFIHGSDGSLIIRVDKNVMIADVKGFDDVDKDFDGDSLKPCDVPSQNFPIWRELESDPLAFQDDANTPRGAGVDINSHIQERSTWRKLPKNARLGKFGGPPFEISNEGRRRELMNELVTFELTCKIGEGGESGTAIWMDKCQIAKGAMKPFNIAKGAAATGKLGNKRVNPG